MANDLGVLNGIFDKDPQAWLKLLGWPGKFTEKIENADETYVVDRAIHARNPEYIGLFDFQAAYDPTQPTRLRRAAKLAQATYDCPARCAAILLVDRADGPAITGTLEDEGGQFDYHVLRIWRISSNIFLEGSIHLLPLAVISDVGNRR